MSIGNRARYPKPGGTGISNGTPGKANYSSKLSGTNRFESEGIDSAEKSRPFPSDQRAGFAPGSGKKKNTSY
jgi:hypothetical protein